MIPPTEPSAEPNPIPAPASSGAALAEQAAPVPRDHVHVVGGVWLSVLAAFLLLCGVCSMLFYIVIPLTTDDAASALSGNVILGGSAGVGMFLGAILLWQGVSAAMDRGSISAARAFPPFGVLVFAFIGALLLGIAALTFRPVAAYAFPPWHFAAALLAPLALLAFAARRLGKFSGFRALVVSFTWGALGATAFAFVLELLVALTALFAVAVVIANLPNSQVLLRDIQNLLLQVQRSRDPTSFLNLVTGPWVTAALFLYFAVIIPPIEEALKALVVALINPLKTRRGDALLWGIAAGAGFAMMENIFNTSSELSAWAFLVLLRVGAAIVHVTTGATMGLGWYAARVQGKWARLIVAYLVSVAYHAAWNATAIFLSTQAVGDSTGMPLNATLVTVVLLGVLVVLAILGLAWTVHAIRRERQAAPAAP